jgi:hypothetical protein
MTNIYPGVQSNGSLFNKIDIVKRNLSNDLNSGYKNIRHYSNSNIADGTTDARSAILAADTDGPIFLPPGIYAIASNTTISNKITFSPGSRLKPGNNVTITLNGGFEALDDQYIFDTSASNTSIIVSKVNHVTANHFGASSTSSTNLVFFERAIHCATISNLALIVPPQTYTIESGWSINDDYVEIVGEDSTKSVLSFTSGSLSFSDCESPKVSNLTIIGNNQDANGVYFLNGTNNATLSNCTLKGFGADPGNQFGVVQFEVVNGCTCVGNSFENNDGNSTCSDIIFTTCKDIICTGNRCISSNGGGISIDNNPDDLDIRFVVSDNIVKDKAKHGIIIGYGADINRGSVSGNVVYNCSVTGMYIQGGSGDSTGEVAITGNIISYCGGSEPVDDAGNCGIYLSGNGGTFTGNFIGDSGFNTNNFPRGTSRGRSILFGHCKNWTITGNTIKNSASISLDFLTQNTAKNILIANNVIVDAGVTLSLLQIGNSADGVTKNFNITNNIFQRLNTDGPAISIVEIGGQGSDITITNNDIRGIRDDSDTAAILWPREYYRQVIITNNRFYNWDRGLDSVYNIGNTVEDWAFGENVYIEDNLFDTVTIPFNLRSDVYSAVGKNNRFMSCNPGFSEKILPASISNGILEGYYVDGLPLRRGRPNDRLKPLYPLLSDSIEWYNSSELPSPSAYTVSSGNIFNHTAHGRRVRDRIRFTTGSHPSPIEAGIDYYVSSTPNSDTFTISSYNSLDTLTLTSTGSGNYQVMSNTPTWVSDMYNWVNRKPYLISRWNGDGNNDGTGDIIDVQGRQNLSWAGTPAYLDPPDNKGIGKAYDLNGSTNYLSATIPAFTTSSKFTICGWVYLDVSGDQMFFCNRDGSGGYQVLIGSDGNLYFGDNTLGNVAVTTSSSISTGTWTHLALVANGSLSAMYANGIRKTNFFTMNWTAPVPNNLIFGAIPTYSLFFLNGRMFDLRVYEKALTSTQLLGLTNGPSLGY